MSLRKEFEKETGYDPKTQTHEGHRHFSAMYVEWLESKLKQSNIRTMDNPDQEEGKRPERPDDDKG